MGNRSVVPRVISIPALLCCIVEDNLRHLAAENSYRAVCEDKKLLVSKNANEYVKAQRCYFQTLLAQEGSLLPVPHGRCQSIAIEFIGLLPRGKDYNAIITLTCCLNSEFRALLGYVIIL